MGDYIVSAMAGGSDSFMDNLDANSLFLVQCVIAGTIGGLEFCFPALFVDTFNTFEVYTSHRLYGATMIVNAIIVSPCARPKITRSSARLSRRSFSSSVC